ncbi:MAG TPA: efflux RND transporter periplasmic adaptor subunit [Planctomycetota bacterium]|jgi:RND family efflux transporter MFP subunit|nr:efflux RND transporter periplasmic adaptor subunit [Planctomycetota bacterium]
MSVVNPNVDLSGFRRTESLDLKPPSRLKWRLVPAVILLLVAALLLSTLTDFFRRPIDVTVVRPAPGQVSRTKGQVLFQAAGWVEPDPFPLRVTPLTKGVVKEVLVQESEPVTAGQVVATLYDEENVLRTTEAEAAVARNAQTLQSAEAELKTSREAFEAALDYREKLGQAEAEAQGTAAEARHRAASVRKAKASLKVAEEELVVQRYLKESGASGPRQVEIAEAVVEERRGDVDVMEADAALAQAQAEKAAVARDRMVREGPLRFEEKLRIEKARAEVARLEAEGRLLTAQRDLAALMLERTRVRAPIDGIVMTRGAVPGSIVDPAMPDAPAICTLFDPLNVRIRVDVPQEVVGRARVGQEAQVFTESRRDSAYAGRVLRVVQQADINKVTLQVHVRVENPDELIRPEMLCQVRFLGTGESGGDAGTSTRETLRIPARVVSDGHVWALAPDGKRAMKKRVEIHAQDEQWVQVLSGINGSDKIIDRGREGLAEGTLVRVTEGA